MTTQVIGVIYVSAALLGDPRIMPSGVGLSAPTYPVRDSRPVEHPQEIGLSADLGTTTVAVGFGESTLGQSRPLE